MTNITDKILKEFDEEVQKVRTQDVTSKSPFLEEHEEAEPIVVKNAKRKI